MEMGDGMTDAQIIWGVVNTVAGLGLGIWMTRVTLQLSELKSKSLDAAELLMERSFEFGEPRVVALLNGTLTIGCVVEPQSSSAAVPKEASNRRHACGRSAEASL